MCVCVREKEWGQRLSFRPHGPGPEGERLLCVFWGRGSPVGLRTLDPRCWRSTAPAPSCSFIHHRAPSPLALRRPCVWVPAPSAPAPCAPHTLSCPGGVSEKTLGCHRAAPSPGQRREECAFPPPLPPPNPAIPPLITAQRASGGTRGGGSGKRKEGAPLGGLTLEEGRASHPKATMAPRLGAARGAGVARRSPTPQRKYTPPPSALAPAPPAARVRPRAAPRGAGLAPVTAHPPPPRRRPSSRGLGGRAASRSPPASASSPMAAAPARPPPAPLAPPAQPRGRRAR